jgi:hypothetical protein
MPGHSNSEEDLDAEEFGSMDELSSPEDAVRPHGMEPAMTTSMPPPSTLVMHPMPQPTMAPSQLIQPQMLQQHM